MIAVSMVSGNGQERCMITSSMISGLAMKEILPSDEIAGFGVRILSLVMNNLDCNSYYGLRRQRLGSQLVSQMRHKIEN